MATLPKADERNYRVDHDFKDDISVATVTAANGKHIQVRIPLYKDADQKMYPDGPYVRNEDVERKQTEPRFYVNSKFIWQNGKYNGSEWGWASNPGSSNWDNDNNKPVLGWESYMPSGSIKWTDTHVTKAEWPWSIEEWEKRQKTHHMIYNDVFQDTAFLSTFAAGTLYLFCWLAGIPCKLIYVITSVAAIFLILLMSFNWRVTYELVTLKLPYRVRANGSRVFTGIRGRGNEGRFGPNGAADPCVTRWKYKRNVDGDPIINVHDMNPIIETDEKGNPIIEVVIITRKDGKQKALPGGMNVSLDGKLVSISQTLVHEYLEEACGHPEDKSQLTEEQKAQQKDFLQFVQDISITVFKGSVSDERDTDNSWMVTEGVSLHDTEASNGIMDTYQRRAGSDACKVEVCYWSPELGLHDKDGNTHELYANHLDIVRGCYQVQRHLLENSD